MEKEEVRYCRGKNNGCEDVVYVYMIFFITGSRVYVHTYTSSTQAGVMQLTEEN